MKKLKDIKNMSSEEMMSRLNELKNELFQNKMKKVTGQLTDTATLWRLRKELAWIKTLSHKVTERRQKTS